MQGEMICPFCHARRPVTSLKDCFPASFTVSAHLPRAAGKWYGDFLCYQCPCGAVATLGGSPAPLRGMDPDEEAAYYADQWANGQTFLEASLCEVHLGTPRRACEVRTNDVSHMESPVQLLWAKRRPAGSD